MARTRAMFPAVTADSAPPEVSIRAPVLVTNGHFSLAFRDAVLSHARWSWTAPLWITPPLTLLVFGIMPVVTSGAVQMNAALEAITPGDATNLTTTLSFDTANAPAPVTVPGVAGRLFVVTIPLTNNDAIAAHDRVWLNLARDGAAGGDTAAGDLYVVGCGLQDAG